MKNLKNWKIYEEYDESTFWWICKSFYEHKVYGPIDDQDVDGWNEDYIFKTWEIFTNKEISIIKSILPKNSEIDKWRIDNHPKISHLSRSQMMIYILEDDNSFTKNELYITKTKDEWFYVSDEGYNFGYQCDQFDGLINCLKFIKDTNLI